MVADGLVVPVGHILNVSSLIPPQTVRTGSVTVRWTQESLMTRRVYKNLALAPKRSKDQNRNKDVVVERETGVCSAKSVSGLKWRNEMV